MNNKFVASIVVCTIYVLVIIVGQKLQAGAGNISLSDLAGKQVLIAPVVGLIFLIVVTLIFGWSREIGIVPPRTLKSVTLAWLPALFIACFFLLGAVIGFPPVQTLLFIGVNTLLVGITEEMGFRGILLNGAASRFRLPAAIALASVAFGAVHALNGFITGEFLFSVAQAVSAAMGAVLFTALLLRSGSIIPGIIVHWLWDFGIFVFTAGRPEDANVTQASGALLLIGPLLFDLPGFLYALWLLRAIGKRSKEEMVG